MEIKCPVCDKQVKGEEFSEWLKGWNEEQWNSPEWRCRLIRDVASFSKRVDKLEEIEPIYEKQGEYIKTLERQLELLQRTLDIAEKFAPRALVMPGFGEVIK